MIGFDTFRCEWDTDRIRIITYSCLALRIIALFSSAELFWYFSKFRRGWKWPCGKLRIRYELLRSLRMWYVSLRNVRIVADGLYVPSAGSVSVCVTGALQYANSRRICNSTCCRLPSLTAHKTSRILNHFVAKPVSSLPPSLSSDKQGINRLFAYCKGGNFNIYIRAWFGYFIC